MYNDSAATVMAFFTVIFSIVMLVIFFVMTSNIGNIARRAKETNARLANVERWLRLIARIQGGSQLTNEEKALITSEPKKAD